MDKIKEYLESEYPKATVYNGYREAVEQLNALIEEHGVSGTRKLLREAGVSPVPLIVKVDTAAKYTFKPCTVTVFLDWEEKVVDRFSLRYLGIPNFYDTGLSRIGMRCYTSEPARHIDGHTFVSWVEYGNICPDCGTPYVKETEEVCPACAANYQLLEYHARAEEILGFEELPVKKSFTGREELSDTLFGIELEYE